MEQYKVLIKSETDGVQTKTETEGVLECLENGVRLTYKDEQGKCVLTAKNGEATVCREGEYVVQLFLKERERTLSKIGVLSSIGEVPTLTKRVEVRMEKDKCVLHLRYALLFLGERQTMKLDVFIQKEKDLG